MEWDQLAGLIDGAGLAHLATSSVTGEPHVAVVFVAREGERMLVTMRSRSGKASNLRANPRVAVMWQGNGAETYLWGRATLVADATEKTRVWNGGVFPFDLAQFYAGQDSEDWLVAHIEPVRAVAMVQTESGLERHTWRR